MYSPRSWYPPTADSHVRWRLVGQTVAIWNRDSRFKHGKGNTIDIKSNERKNVTISYSPNSEDVEAVGGQV